MKKTVLCLFLCSLSQGALTQERSCENIITQIDITTEFLSILNEIIDQNILTKDEFALWAKKINSGELENPIPHAMTPYGPVFTKSIFQVKYKLIQKYLDSHQLDQNIIKEKISELFEKITGQIVKKEMVKVETQTPWIKASFIPFNQDESIMKTPVTQWMWTNVMGDNPSKIPESGEELTKIMINKKAITMIPDMAVDNISGMMAKSFIETINYLSLSRNPLIYTIIPEHQDGKFYHMMDMAHIQKLALENQFSIANNPLNLFKKYTVVKPEYNKESTSAVDSTQPILWKGQPLYSLFDGQFVSDQPSLSYSDPDNEASVGHIGLSPIDRMFKSEDNFRKINFNVVYSVKPYDKTSNRLRLIQSNRPGDMAQAVQDDQVRKMKFEKITYQWNKSDNPIELMTTPVTQWMWSKVMGENPSHFYYGEDYQLLINDSKIIPMQPDHPVESMTPALVQEFLKKINELADLNDPKIKEFYPDFVVGDQFTLPKQEFLHWLDGGYCREMTSFRQSQNAEIWQDYAWYAANSSAKTHSVAQKKAIILSGKSFFDLTGNVTMMSQNFQMTFGSSYHNKNIGMGVYPISNQNIKSPMVGLRLVRLRKGE